MWSRFRGSQKTNKQIQDKPLYSVIERLHWPSRFLAAVQKHSVLFLIGWKAIIISSSTIIIIIIFVLLKI